MFSPSSSSVLYLCFISCNILTFLVILLREFQVSLEENPEELFSNTSAEKCWEMVVDKVIKEIKRQTNLGRAGFPPLQHLQAINGLHMFGFQSPAIKQVEQPITIQSEDSSVEK